MKKNNKDNAKRAAALVIAVLLMVSMISAGDIFGARNAIAAETKPTNYLTSKWEARYFGGTIEETEENGEQVTTYTPDALYSWFSPSINLLNDVKTMLGEKQYVEVVISFEIRGVFQGGNKDSTCNVLIRAISPRTGTHKYPKEDSQNWDGKGTPIDELYYEATGGESLFSLDVGGGNFMNCLEPSGVPILADEWTRFESEPFYFDKESAPEDIFGDWALCLHQVAYDAGLTAIQIRKAGLYDLMEYVPTKAPTAEATAQPTDQAAQATAQTVTDKPAGNATAAPVNNKTDAPDPGKVNEKKGGNVGLIIGIACGVAAVAAVVVAVVLSKKKVKK